MRGSHRNEVSPLTQGLRYRAACDEYFNFFSCLLYMLCYAIGQNIYTKHVRWTKF